MSHLPPVVMTVAGSDSGAGAGIQADLKTMSCLGCYGVSAIAALTAQSGLGVFGIFPSSPEFLDLQIKTLLDGFPVAAAKTGMLFSSDLIKVTADNFRPLNIPLVVDPVCVSKSGHHLLQPEAVTALKKELLPLATLLTPNVPEAELISGLKMDPTESPAGFAARCGQAIIKMGVGAVLIKGGHFAGQEAEVTDWLICQDYEPVAFAHPRIDTDNSHGTGCTLSAALASELALGEDLRQCIKNALDYLDQALRASYAPGLGIGPVNHFAGLGL